MPVIWATQVLETLAKTGLPSRAGITDAAMGGAGGVCDADKGPHIIEAMRTLDDIMQRMRAHQTKKRPPCCGHCTPGMAPVKASVAERLLPTNQPF